MDLNLLTLKQTLCHSCVVTECVSIKIKTRDVDVVTHLVQAFQLLSGIHLWFRERSFTFTATKWAGITVLPQRAHLFMTGRGAAAD